MTSASSKRSEPFPRDPLGRQLCEFFSYRWQPILAPVPPDASQKPQWHTETRYPLRPQTLWSLWQDANQLVGVRFGSTTTYALLDVDVTSAYHPARSPEALPRLQAALESIGLYRSIWLRSSWSGGLHLYMPLPQPVSTFKLAIALKHGLEAHGFSLRAGQLETFPNVKRYGQPGEFVEYNAHRLPLQPGTGSILLDNELQPDYGGLTQFFQRWQTAAAGQDLEELQQAMTDARQQHRVRSATRRKGAQTWRADLEADIERGWTDYGQTNALLKTIACYGVVFRSLSEDALVDYVEQTAIQSPGYSTWCRHQTEIRSRAQAWASAAEQHYWPLGTPARRVAPDHPSSPDETHSDGNNIVPFNRQRAEAAQARIRQAVATLRSQETLPNGVTARAKAIVAEAHCSFTTLQKYKPLWHPNYENSDSTNAINPTENNRDPATPAATPTEEINRSNLGQSQDEPQLHTLPYMKGNKLDGGSVSSQSYSSSLGEGAGRGNSSFPQVKSHLSRRRAIATSATPTEQPRPTSLKVTGKVTGQSKKLIRRSEKIARKPAPQSNRQSNPSTHSFNNSFPEQIDVDELISRIQIHVCRLNWSLPQMQDFIADHFGGRRRSQLRDAELIELLALLSEQSHLAHHSLSSKISSG